jgi:hypothetical protein
VPQCLVFFAAFAVFLYRRQAAANWRTAAAVLALFGAAVATKEHTLVLPGLLLLTDYYWNPGFSSSGIRRNWRIYVPLALAALAGLGFVARILAHSRSAGFGASLTWHQYFFTECRAFFVYLRLLVFPAGQNVDWDFPASYNILDHGAIFYLSAIMVMLGAAIYFRRRYQSGVLRLSGLLLATAADQFVCADKRSACRTAFVSAYAWDAAGNCRGLTTPADRPPETGCGLRRGRGDPGSNDLSEEPVMGQRHCAVGRYRAQVSGEGTRARATGIH